MKVITIQPRGFGCNTFVVTADNKTAVVIDPSEPLVLSALEQLGLEYKAVLLTHGHFDHVGGCAALQAIGAHIYCNEREKPLIFSPEYLGLFGGVHVPEFEVTHTFKDGDKLSFCGIDFKVIHTAGHTAGSCCFVAEDKIFTGDTLFCGGIGRTDLYTGDYRELAQSVRKLYALKGDYTLYCGHGENSTLEKERRTNPYVR